MQKGDAATLDVCSPMTLAFVNPRGLVFTKAQHLEGLRSRH
jgi:hypothetical protein